MERLPEGWKVFEGGASLKEGQPLYIEPAPTNWGDYVPNSDLVKSLIKDIFLGSKPTNIINFLDYQPSKVVDIQDYLPGGDDSDPIA